MNLESDVTDLSGQPPHTKGLALEFERRETKGRTMRDTANGRGQQNCRAAID